ncbi:hypothetical protein HQ590_11920 [bacterium]|nr:hypothetical protein [bacterium]
MTTQPALTFRIESNYLCYGCRTVGATEYHAFPVRVSVPAAPGRFSPQDRLEVRDDHGATVPGIVRPLHCWSDGSVRVWEVWMAAGLKRGDCRTFELGPARAVAGDLPGKLLQQPSAFTITAAWGAGATASERVAFDDRDAELGLAVQEDEREFELRASDGVLIFKGALIRRSWSWYPAIELAVRVINYSPGEELAVKAVTLEFELPGHGSSRYVIRHATVAGKLVPRLFESDQPFEVRADAGGIHVTDVRQLGREQTDYATYERGTYAEAVAPWIAARDDDHTWLLAVPETTERMPKGWAIQGRRVKLELHPDWAEPLAWLRGMALYQRFHLARLPRTASPEQCENESFCWLRPPLVAVDADVYRAAGWRIPFRYEPARFPRTELTIRDTWNFSWTPGTFDWGDQVGANKGSLPLLPGMSPSQGVARNHEYDFVACAAKEFARTGRPEIWKQCRAAAEHLMYTDFVAVSDDPWKEGGVPHHCNRHTTGAAYPSHMWIEGLTLYYQLSGDPYALRVARRVGDFFVKYVADGFLVVQSTSREMGWALVSLAAIYDLTREPRYLAGIKKIVDFYLDAGVARYFPGDATFAIGVGMIGLDRVRPFHREPEVKSFILGVLDRIMATRVDPLGIFDYNFDSERKGFTWIQTHLPEALRVGSQLSGDLKYLQAAWRLYQIHQAGIPLTVQNRYQTDCGYAAGYHITWTMGCLASFAERGWLDQLQFAAPE